MRPPKGPINSNTNTTVQYKNILKKQEYSIINIIKKKEIVENKINSLNNKLKELLKEEKIAKNIINNLKIDFENNKSNKSNISVSLKREKKFVEIFLLNIEKKINNIIEIISKLNFDKENIEDRLSEELNAFDAIEKQCYVEGGKKSLKKSLKKSKKK